MSRGIWTPYPIGFYNTVTSPPPITRVDVFVHIHQSRPASYIVNNSLRYNDPLTN